MQNVIRTHCVNCCCSSGSRYYQESHRARAELQSKLATATSDLSEVRGELRQVADAHRATLSSLDECRGLLAVIRDEKVYSVRVNSLLLWLQLCRHHCALLLLLPLIELARRVFLLAHIWIYCAPLFVLELYDNIMPLLIWYRWLWLRVWVVLKRMQPRTTMTQTLRKLVMPVHLNILISITDGTRLIHISRHIDTMIESSRYRSAN